MCIRDRFCCDICIPYSILQCISKKLYFSTLNLAASIFVMTHASLAKINVGCTVQDILHIPLWQLEVLQHEAKDILCKPTLTFCRYRFSNSRQNGKRNRPVSYTHLDVYKRQELHNNISDTTQTIPAFQD